jgi:hypothetical protein
VAGDLPVPVLDFGGGVQQLDGAGAGRGAFDRDPGRWSADQLASGVFAELSGGAGVQTVPSGSVRRSCPGIHPMTSPARPSGVSA